MANVCDFTMKIVGKKKENVEKLVKYLDSNYIYISDAANGDLKEEDRKKYPFCFAEGNWKLYSNAEKHFYRVFEVYPGDIEPVDDNWETIVSGNCAWSVLCCMTDDRSSCYSYNMNQPLLEHSTTLQKESQELNLYIEVFSSEPGMEFAEHYLISRGEVIKDECYDYHEYCLEDYRTKEEAENDYGIIIADEEWAEGGYISRCEINPNDPEWSI